MSNRIREYYDDWISSFDFPTTLSPDVNDKQIQYDTLSIPYNTKINELVDIFDVSENNLFLTVFLFNLVNFSFSKDILVAYNKNAIGYHFNVDLTVEVYIKDFNSRLGEVPESDEFDFESEILFATQEYRKEDYKFIFSYAGDEISIEYDSSYYSKGLITEFLNEFNALIDEFEDNPKGLLKDISDSEEILEESYPLTQNQLGVYWDCLKNPENLSYNISKKIEFTKPIDVDKLKKSICEAIDNHPYLKTRIVMKDGEVYQQRICLDVGDLIEIADGEINVEDFVKPFALEDNLFRFKIVNDSILLADFHQILVDEISLDILFGEIAKIYDGIEFELEESDGFDYMSDEVKVEKSPLFKESELFFFNKIKQFDEATLMTPDLSGDEEIGVGLKENLYLDKKEIDGLCNGLSVSQDNLFLATTAFVLSKFAYNKNLLIATVTDGRFTPNQQNVLAKMEKTLPLALNLNSELTIAELFEYVNKESGDVMTHSSYPLTKISDEYGIVPEFSYVFNDRISSKIKINGEEVLSESLKDNLKYKVNLSVVASGDKYDVSVKYNSQLYSPLLVKTFLDSFSIVLNKFTGLNQDTQLKDISIVDGEELSIDDLDYDDIPEYRLNKIFESQVELNPNKVILYADDGEFTYDELNKKANRIAHSLIKKGVGPEDRVMFILNRNSNVIASIFGILKSGGAFIPVDSEYPADRIEHVLTDSESKFIIVDDVIDKKGIDLTGYEDKLLDVEELLKETDISNPNPEVSSDNMAYLIYTSGSTGLPKGVILEHGNIANFVYPDPRNISIYELVHNLEKEGYRVLSTTTVAFDVFQQELMGSLLNSVPMVFANDIEYKDPIEMMDLIHRCKANVYVSTPSRLLQYLEIEAMRETMYGFKAYLCAGEPFPRRLYELLSENSKGKIFNMYGPTETTVYCNGQLIDSPEISIGKELFNVYELIMDSDSNPLPPNVIGELYIGGKGVSREYLNRPEKNAEAFSEINGIRFYHSGDFAKVGEEGKYYVFGRMDNQIKLRGLRIEIGEIESVISKYDPIKSVAVVVREIKGNDHLCAYFTVHEEYRDKHREENGYSIDVDDLKATLAGKLTYYMVPTVYMELDEMPQTLNGKTDLRNLPEPILITDYVAPKNEVEAFFSNVFAELLGLERVSVTDNFFEIGGTSLLVSKITMDALNRGYELGYGDVFKNPTPRLLSEFISHADSTKIAEEANYDYSEINQLLKKNNLESMINGDLEDNLGNILLTGATGFLGVHVLKELLEAESGTIYCFVRSKGNLSAVDRLKSVFFYYFADEFDENVFDERLQVIEGDITDFKYFENIISLNIDTIFNCAANVKHFSFGSEQEDINFGGVINGLKFAKMKNAKYVQVSTYSVAGESIDNFPPLDVGYTEEDLYIGQGMDNPYINSKFLAERAVLEAAIEDDLDVKIMRAGNLMARSSDSEFQINFESNAFINSLKSFVILGKMPYGMLSEEVEFSQIDITAKSIVALAKTPKECRVFHPYNSHKVTFADIIEIIKPLGLDIEPCENEEYEHVLNDALSDKSKQEGIFGIITALGSDNIKTKWIPVDNDYTTQVLYRLGINWPMISREYIYTFAEYLNDLDFFSVGNE